LASAPAIRPVLRPNQINARGADLTNDEQGRDNGAQLRKKPPPKGAAAGARMYPMRITPAALQLEVADRPFSVQDIRIGERGSTRLNEPT